MSIYVDEEVWAEWITWRTRKEQTIAQIDELRRRLRDDPSRIRFDELPDLLATIADEASATGSTE